MGPGASYSCWVEIDLKAIETNIAQLRQLTQVQVMAVVKANAYGHGSVPVTRAALRGGANWLGVARLEESLELRRADISAPVLLLGYTPPSKYSVAIENNVSLTIWDRRQLQDVSRLAGQLGKPGRVHLKVDTGMGRLGVQPEETLELAAQISRAPNVIFEGIFTHFARADEAETTTTEIQKNQFLMVLGKLAEAKLRPDWIHASNSAASLTRPSAHFNLVRAGISIYGLHPGPDCRLPSSFSASLTWKTVISHIKVMPPGRGISYGHVYVTQKNERIGTLPVGYADGYRRAAGNAVLVAGQRVPVVGRVCMDQIMVNLDSAPEAMPGDEVVLIGKQGDVHITAEDVADAWGTINYEVVCGIGARVPRLYLEN